MCHNYIMLKICNVSYLNINRFSKNDSVAYLTSSNDKLVIVKEF